MRFSTQHFCALSAATIAAQLNTPQSNTWNSSFRLTPDQVASANLSNATASNLNVATQFEQTNWAGFSTQDDPFYRVPANSSFLAPGSLLKVEEYTNTSLYTMPPNTALSRILFQSENFNGSAVPASAFVLWPWMPREDPRCPGKYQVVVWGHGTSGCFDECAPSHIRNLWYQYSAPYVLSLQGYVVVAPDYAGLGVSQGANGSEIKHQYLASAAQANDMFHAVNAAQAAFPALSERFVAMGHSQGGGVAWAAAERQARRPAEGYLGAIAGSPVTNFTRGIDFVPSDVAYGAFFSGNALDTIFPDFDLSAFLTAQGQRVWQLAKQIRSCNSGIIQIISEPGLIQPNILSTGWWKLFVDLTTVGGKPIAGPLLVIHGTNDTVVDIRPTTEAVDKTCAAYPNSTINYQTFHGADHVPVLFASQRVWLDWIRDRFEGKPVRQTCQRKEYAPARPVAAYQTQVEYYLELATQAYEVA